MTTNPTIKKTVPEYVKKAKETSFKDQVNTLLDNNKTNKLRSYSWSKEEPLRLLNNFAKTYKYGVLPDTLVCFRIYISDNGINGELGLTYIPVYRQWEFYVRGLDKHSRVVCNFKEYLNENGFTFKILK